MTGNRWQSTNCSRYARRWPLSSRKNLLPRVRSLSNGCDNSINHPNGAAASIARGSWLRLCPLVSRSDRWTCFPAQLSHLSLSPGICLAKIRTGRALFCSNWFDAICSIKSRNVRNCASRPGWEQDEIAEAASRKVLDDTLYSRQPLVLDFSPSSTSRRMASDRWGCRVGFRPTWRLRRAWRATRGNPSASQDGRIDWGAGKALASRTGSSLRLLPSRWLDRPPLGVNSGGFFAPAGGGISLRYSRYLL